ncbi:MAG: alpha/beta fold hydrolase [Patescibacteria group bacterium]
MRVILIHGFNSSPEQNFHPWLADQLRAKGFEVVVPKLSLDNREEINIPDIIDQAKVQIGTLRNDDIILGHSLGAFIILQYLEAVEMMETPHAIIMVAPPWKVSRPELRRLFIADLEADVLMWKARGFYVVHSSDDTLVPAEHGKKFAEALKAKFIEVNGCGHFMDEQYPILLEIVERIAALPFEFSPGLSLPNDFE